MRLLAKTIRIITVLVLVVVWSDVLLAGEVSERPSESMDSKIVLFSQPFCPGCEAAKYYFREHQIPYLEFDITSSKAAQDTFVRLGGRGTPFMLIGGQRMHGFSVPRLEQRLAELGISGGES